MADTHDMQDGKTFYFDVPQTCTAFPLKGSNALDWRMKNRLARIFSPDDCRTVMLAVDHGYFRGPTSGVEPEALAMCYRAVNEGAARVGMGHNIFQCEAPQAMIQAVRAVVHGDDTPEKALDLYHSLKSMEERIQYAK